MEACPKIQMINFDIKLCNYEGPVITEKIHNYIYTHYQENPDSFQKELNELLQLRENAVSASKDFMGLNIMKKYYRQLQFLSNRFPMKSGEACETEFSWDHLYNDKEIVHTDVRYELACILYNIGAMHSYLGCMDKRNNDDGIKISCTHFQYAAWAFQSVREMYSSLDMSGDISEILMKFNSDLMLAQAQECVLEKSIVDNRKHSINAKISSQIVDYYKMGLSTTEDSQFLSVVGFRRFKEFVQYCQYKTSYYTGLANYFSSISSSEQSKHGEAVGFIQVAEAKLMECHKMKYLKEFNENLKFTLECIETKSKALKKDNDFVYHEKIISPENLPEVKGVSLVKPIQIDFEKDPEIATPDIFGRLVSMKAHELSSLYSEEKAKLLRSIISQKEEKDLQLEQFMSALQLDQLHLDNLDYLKLPKKLLECCAAISVRPKLAKEELPQTMKQIIDVSVQIKSQLDDIEEVLQNELTEARQYKKDNGEDTSDSSDSQSEDEINKNKLMKKKSPLKAKMRDILDKYDLMLKRYNDGNTSNMALHEAFNSVIKNLQILSLPISELTEKLPKIEEINDEESKIVRDKLVTLLAKVKEMKDQREELSRRFLRAIQEDDLTKIIASHQNEIEKPNDFFNNQLKKHEQLTTYLQQNLQAQDNILRALADSNASFTDSRQKILNATQSRNTFIDNLIVSYQSVNDLIEKARKGVVYFENLNDPIIKLHDEVKDFCQKSKQERENKKKIMQRVNSIANNIPESPVNNYLPKHILPQYNNNSVLNPSFDLSNKMSLPQPQLQSIDNHQFKIQSQEFNQQLNVSEITQMMSQLPISTDRPKLKDFLPYMKPSTTRTPASTRGKPSGPPQIDRNLTNFITPAISNTQNMPQPNIINQNVQIPPQPYPHQNQIFQNQNISPKSFNNLQNIPSNPQQVLQHNNSQMHVPTSQAISSNMNANIQNNSSSMMQYQNAISNSNQAALLLQQQQQKQIAEQERLKRELEEQNNYKITQQKLLEQQIKEKELQLKKQQLEQQEQQLKLQQQQIQLQQQHQQFLLLQQQQKQQQQHQQIQPPNSNWPIGTTGLNQSNAANLNQQFTQPQIQPNNQPQGLSTTLNTLNSPLVAPVPPILQTNQQIGMPNLTNQNKIKPPEKSLDPESVYKPGYMKFDVPQQSLQPNQSLRYEANNFNKVEFKTQQQLPNMPVSGPSNVYYLPQQQQQQQSQQISSNVPALAPVQVQAQPIQPKPKPSAIDDLLDLFDSNSPNINQTPLVLQPLKVDLLLNKEDLVSSPKISRETQILPEKSLVDEKPIPNNNSLVNDLPKLNQGQLSPSGSVSSLNLNNRPTTPSNTPLTLTNNGLNSAKKLNFLNNPLKLERFVNEVNKFENHVHSLSKKTLATSMTLLEKEWKELQDYQDKLAASSNSLTISIARCYPNKNRFQDLLPYDQTRVILQNKSNDDYINATHIGCLIESDIVSVSNKNNNNNIQPPHPNFIISQLPFTSTSTDLFDFWQMVLQQQIELIVCLCRENEFNQQYYWPIDKQATLNVFTLKVNLQSVKETTNSIQRVFTVTNTVENQSRTVVILQQNIKANNSKLNVTQVTASVTTGIGLNEMPENISGFLKFIKECEHFYLTQQRNHSHPILVHCMNGVSRSAVFLLVYTMIQIIDTSCDTSASFANNSSMISSEFMLRLVKQMRSKRKYMIQSTYHLKYAYDALLYYLKDILIKEGVLTNSTFNQSQAAPDISNNLTSQIGTNSVNTNEQKISHMRKQSAEMSSIIKDESLVSIQSSKDHFSLNLNESFGKNNDNNSENYEKINSEKKLENDKPTSLIELCDPKNFSLSLSDESLKKKPQKITKKDFFNNQNSTSFQTNLSNMDPFALLDSLKK